MNTNNKKSKKYYKYPREDVLALISPNIKYVLDVGCGAGELGEKRKEKYNVKEIVGIEINPKIANIAKNHLDHVICANIEEIELPYDNEYFDCIIYADILEHLVNPWSILKKQNRFLKKDGTIIISIPNVRHLFIIKNLIKGDWPYSERGV